MFQVIYAEQFLEFLNNSVLKRSSFNSKKSQEYKNALSSLSGINTHLSGKKSSQVFCIAKCDDARIITLKKWTRCSEGLPLENDAKLFPL